MADVFKVLQYWTFDQNANSQSSALTTVRVGMAVHFIKSSMLKAKIHAGVKDELVDHSKSWCDFSLARIQQHMAANNCAHLSDESAAGLADEDTAIASTSSIEATSLASSSLLLENKKRDSFRRPSSTGNERSAFVPPVINKSVDFVLSRYLCMAVFALLALVVIQHKYNYQLSSKLTSITSQIASLKQIVTNRQVEITASLQSGKGSSKKEDVAIKHSPSQPGKINH